MYIMSPPSRRRHLTRIDERNVPTFSIHSFPKLRRRTRPRECLFNTQHAPRAPRFLSSISRVVSRNTRRARTSSARYCTVCTRKISARKRRKRRCATDKLIYREPFAQRPIMAVGGWGEALLQELAAHTASRTFQRIHATVEKHDAYNIESCTSHSDCKLPQRVATSLRMAPKRRAPLVGS